MCMIMVLSLGGASPIAISMRCVVMKVKSVFRCFRLGMAGEVDTESSPIGNIMCLWKGCQRELEHKGRIVVFRCNAIYTRTFETHAFVFGVGGSAEISQKMGAYVSTCA